MSHFSVLVFSKKRGIDVEDLLAPFDENITMEPYVEFTKQQAIANVRKEIEEYRDGTYAKYCADKDKYRKDHADNQAHLDYLENDFPKKLFWTDEECYEDKAKWYKGGDDDDYDMPCMIDADGNLLSTYNPKAKWDWYEIGGRWSGGLTTINGAETNKDFVCMIDWNKDPAPFAFVTPDGEWHERGTMGWWAIVINEKDEQSWDAEFKKFVNSLEDDVYVTLVDCHI